MKKRSIISIFISVLLMVFSLSILVSCDNTDINNTPDNFSKVYMLEVQIGNSNLVAVDGKKQVANEQYVSIGNKEKIDLDKVVVTGIYRDGGFLKNIVLNKDQYNVDYDNLNYNKNGKYQILYTKKGDSNAKDFFNINVSDEYINFEATIEGSGSMRVNGANNAVKEYSQRILKANTAVDLIATPDEGYSFKGWYRKEKDIPITKDIKYTFTSNKEDFSIIAKFSKSINGEFYDLANVYQVRLDAGESNLKTTSDSLLNDNAVSFYQYVEEGDNTKDINKVELYGVYRNLSDEVVTLKLTNKCFTIDKGGLDYNQKGTYTIKVKTKYAEEFVCIFKVIVYERKLESLYLQASINGEGAFVNQEGVTPNGFYKEGLELGDEITLEVVANEGYEFVCWYKNTSEGKIAKNYISSNAKQTFIIDDENGVSVVAYFRKKIKSLEFGVGTSKLSTNQKGTIETFYTLEINDEFNANMEGVEVYGIAQADDERILLDYGIDYYISLDGNVYDGTKIDTSTSYDYYFYYTLRSNLNIEKLIFIRVIEFYTYEIIYSTDEGSVSINGIGINPYSKRKYKKGAEINLVAKAKENYKFVKWVYYDNNTEVVLSTEAKYSFYASESLYIIAIFEKIG